MSEENCEPARGMAGATCNGTFQNLKSYHVSLRCNLEGEKKDTHYGGGHE